MCVVDLKDLYIGLRKGFSPGSIASGQFVIAAASDIWFLPALPRIPFEHRAALPASQVAAAGASSAPHKRTMGSSLNAPERAIPRSEKAVGATQGRGNSVGRGRGRGRGGGRVLVNDP